MKKVKLFIAAATLTLGVTGFFAFRTEDKFAAITDLYNSAGVNIIDATSSSVGFYNTDGGGLYFPAYLRVNGADIDLYANSGASVRAYYKP